MAAAAVNSAWGDVAVVPAMIFSTCNEHFDEIADMW